MSKGKIVKIGGAAAFLGDSILGPDQLADVEGLNYLVFDYLAEMTLSAFAQAAKADPRQGYAGDFVNVTLRHILHRCSARGIKIISNAGGLNPHGCAAAIAALQKELGCDLRVAVVDGDDILPLLPALRRSGLRDFYDGGAMPDAIGSANAYLGALPIARALALGADIVITGRIVDSAAALGALIHEFGWAEDDYDRLAAGSLVGHILECGCQATGGVFTDWRTVLDWENSGYPIVEARSDGSFVVTKPPGTGGLVSPATVSEQILYEVGDPANYLLPDVTCDFTGVRVVSAGADRVAVSDARGRPPTDRYKISATYDGGFRCVAQLSIFGFDAVDKARRSGEALVARTRKLLRDRQLGDFDRVAVTVLGAEDSYGPHAREFQPREAVMRVAVQHSRHEALDLFSRESRAPGTSWAPGTTSGSTLTLNGRPAVEPLYRLFSALVPKTLLEPAVTIDGKRHAVAIPPGQAFAPVSAADTDGADTGAGSRRTVPLIELAHARCGDKGNSSNIAVFARKPEYLPIIRQELSCAAVGAYLAHLVTGSVERFDVPGLNAVNFLLQESLDGGGPISLRADPLGKGMAQMVLGMPIRIPADIKLPADPS